MELELKLQKNSGIYRGEVPFHEYFNSWYEIYKADSIMPITLSRYKATEHLIKKFFGEQKINEIKRADYQSFINEYGKQHAPSTVIEKNNILKKCVQNALYDSVIEKDFTFNTVVVSNKNRKVKVDYMNVQELKRLTEYLLNHLDYHYSSNYMILTAIFTGARIGEIMALTWKDINLNFKTININKAWNYFKGGKFKETKTESSNRIIPINKTLVNVFKELKNAKDPQKTDLLFTTQFGTIPSSNAVNKTLRKNMEKLDINRKNFHFHSLCHSHVAYLLSQGVDIYAIAKRLGHSDITTTTRTYAYLIDELEKSNDEKIISGLDLLVDKNVDTKTAIK
ncbi:site-specific integrase [Pediococcus argentinicus]|uniref:Phage integrase n=1 Tax=Pediococcus argentinicus TaxID=480391 RepID=A0A0R2NIN0_9LACO|nr:site-specific integrase [Pediococcus argentinicus]KRO25657.1 phage integrase [Pediococcus argentinicus]GEP19176.1 site-specific integrase [Pediococcus argentinicus]